VEDSATKLVGPEQASVLGRLEYELDNIRLALESSATDERKQVISLRIAQGLTRFWEVRGYMTEGRRWLERVLSLDAQFPVTLRANAYLSSGTLAYRQSDYEASIRGYSAALDLGSTTGDISVISRAQCGLGLIEYREGDIGSAARSFEMSLDNARRISDRDCTAWALQNLGRVREQTGDLDAAEMLQRESLALREESGDLFSIARSLNELGIILRQQNRRVEAEHFHRMSLAMRLHIGDLQGQAISMRDLARVLEERDRLTAKHWLLESMEIEHRVGDVRGVAVCIERLAHLCAMSGLYVRAVRLLGGAASIRETTKSARELSDSRMCDEIRDVARSALGSNQFDQLLSLGRATSVPDIIAFSYDFRSE
jgi:tetratricopeptide (TPR) repeat protein